MRSASGPATSRAIRIFTRFSPDSTCCMLWGGVAGPRADTRAPDSASFAPASAWTGVTGTGRRGRRPRSPGHIPRYDRDVHSSPLAPPLALHEPTFIRSDVHGTSTQSSYHSHTWGTLTAQHSDGTQHSHRHHAHAHGTTQGERMGGESARCRRVTREGAWPAAAVAPPGASTPLDAP